MSSLEATDAVDVLNLNTWPVCYDNLSWSSDGDLAVAGRDVVHFVTQKPRFGNASLASTVPENWIVETVPVNCFEPSEWPYQKLAPLHIFSIGEEQSDSHVISIAWSPPGIGIHRRSVLAVLTANLLLSLWESNGTDRSWERTCVVNHGMRKHFRANKDKTSDELRKACRITRFTWSPLLIDTTANEGDSAGKWGIQHLIVANDDGEVVVMRIQKAAQEVFGGWESSVAALCQLPSYQTLAKDVETNSIFYQALYSNIRVFELRQTAWHMNASSEPLLSLSSILTAVRGSETVTLKLIARFSTETLPPGSHSSDQHELGPSQPRVSLVILEQTPCTANSNKTLQEEVESQLEHDIRKVLMSLQREYDRKFNLQGNLQVRFWGVSRAPGADRTAVCITFHATDVIAHFTQSQERVYVLIKRKKIDCEASDVVTATIEEIHERLLSFTAKISTEQIYFSPVDRVLCHIANEYRASMFPAVDGRATDDVEMANGNEAIPKQKASDDVNCGGGTLGEICEICGSNIEFQDPGFARCATGHEFTRCSISFLAIQEPGISKYCSKCGKQFLNLAKTASQKGPSLVARLFEEFEICPYCNGKFRG